MRSRSSGTARAVRRRVATLRLGDVRARRAVAQREQPRAAVLDGLADAQVHHGRELRRRDAVGDDDLRVLEVGVACRRSRAIGDALPPRAPVEVLHAELAEDVLQQIRLFVQQAAAADRGDGALPACRDRVCGSCRPTVAIASSQSIWTHSPPSRSSGDVTRRASS